MSIWDANIVLLLSFKLYIAYLLILLSGGVYAD
uniref:Uncharacterized protein n=1 Tax=Rhizophora mucronata TaxID=61149 RepID=A0A2P2QGM5_RHIMU